MTTPRTVTRSSKPSQPDPIQEQIRRNALADVPPEMLAVTNPDDLLAMSEEDRNKTVREWRRRNSRSVDGTETLIRESAQPPQDAEVIPLPTPPHSNTPTVQQSNSVSVTSKPAARRRAPKKPTTSLADSTLPADALLTDLTARWTTGSANMARLDVLGAVELATQFRELRRQVFRDFQMKLNKSKVVARAVEWWLATHSSIDGVDLGPQGTADLSVRIPRDTRTQLDAFILEQDIPVPYARVVCAALSEYLPMVSETLARMATEKATELSAELSD